jgi:hypothetical protein
LAYLRHFWAQFSTKKGTAKYTFIMAILDASLWLNIGFEKPPSGGFFMCLTPYWCFLKAKNKSQE